jgi:hypothetical protein
MSEPGKIDGYNGASASSIGRLRDTRFSVLSRMFRVAGSESRLESRWCSGFHRGFERDARCEYLASMEGHRQPQVRRVWIRGIRACATK